MNGSSRDVPQGPPPIPTSESAAEYAPTRWRRAADRAVNHRMWVTCGALAGVIGLALSAFQIWQSFQPAPEDLQVGTVAIGSPESIPALQISRVANNEPLGRIQYSANPIDLTLKNNGEKMSTITDVIADVQHFELLGDCTSSGAGEAGVKAEYQIKLPSEPTSAGLGERRVPIQFHVNPGSVERMSLTVGPEISSFYYYPYVVGVSIELIHDDGSVLDVGAFTFLTNLKAVNAGVEDSRDVNCARKNLEILQPIYAYQSIKSVELDALRSAYQSVVINAQTNGRESQPKTVPGPNAPSTTPAAPNLETTRPVVPA